MEKSVLLYSHGIGPILSPINRYITALILNRVSCITVREDNSREDLIAMGVRPSLIQVSADPVVAMHDPSPEQGRLWIAKSLKPTIALEDAQPIIGLSVRTKDFRGKEEREALIHALNALSPRYHIVLLPFYFKEDIEISRYLAEQLPHVHLIDRKLTTQEALDIISAMDAFVGTRLHSLIIGAVAGVPVMGISYDPKIDYFLETLGLRPLITVTDFRADVVVQGIEHTLLNREAIQAEIAAKVQVQRERLETGDAALKALADKL